MLKTRILPAAFVALTLTTGVVQGQDGRMMNGGSWHDQWMGGYGGFWTPVLVVIVIALVAWIAIQKRK